jgi:hypothetical protein
VEATGNQEAINNPFKKKAAFQKSAEKEFSPCKH